eukprot:CAMPEP_0178397796 /NCGR_PEP_ID=MMETSP0689_2-20121128/14438_1 /TAXON_ID=160604 /ORGANISM="Amphidinium massartii, Strain CS-259" /LENGTH=54 /DNA_ID=CAMNT_0020018531 /DNA_START=67 /DNA_END=228 /DNA_ORIENTATION=+
MEPVVVDDHVSVDLQSAAIVGVGGERVCAWQSDLDGACPTHGKFVLRCQPFPGI